MNRFTETFTVRWYEAGRDEQLQIPTLLSYLEHAAGVHADQLGLSVATLTEMGITWVLARMKLVFHRRPMVGETVIIETWPAGIERMLFRRDYLVRDEQGNRLIAGASYWVVFGLDSRKIVAVPPSLKERFPDTEDVALTDCQVRLPAISGGVEGPSFRARLSDIDRNHHVNNGRFVDFILEASHHAGRHEDSFTGLEIAYRSEALFGDRIKTYTLHESDDCLLHSLVRDSDGQELVRARTTWAV